MNLREVEATQMICMSVSAELNRENKTICQKAITKMTAPLSPPFGEIYDVGKYTTNHMNTHNGGESPKCV